MLRNMSSLQCSNEETPRASKTARVLFETSFDALPDAVALKILLLVPIDARLRIGALLQRRCARVLREPDAWRVIDFGGCEAPVTDRALLLLCARAGTALRCLDLSGCDVYGARLTTSGIIGALRGSAGLNLECLYTRAAVDYQRYLCRFSRTDAVALRKACPLLQHGDFVLHLHPYLDQPEVASALHALPGDVYLETERNVQTLGSYARGAADSCRALVGLRLELAGYSEAGFKALKDVIVCAKVQELSLHGSPYDADQHSICAALARAFRRSHLQSFDLNARNLRNEVQAVAAVLSDTNCSLAWLRLAATGHGSGPSYAARLAAALAANSSLTELHILDTSLDDDDVSVLAHACVSHTTLQAVCFNGGGISKPLCKTLTTLMAVKTPRPLEWCWAFECMIENQDDEVRSAATVKTHVHLTSPRDRCLMYKCSSPRRRSWNRRASLSQCCLSLSWLF